MRGVHAGGEPAVLQLRNGRDVPAVWPGGGGRGKGLEGGSHFTCREGGSHFTCREGGSQKIDSIAHCANSTSQFALYSPPPYLQLRKDLEGPAAPPATSPLLTAWATLMGKLRMALIAALAG